MFDYGNFGLGLFSGIFIGIIVGFIVEHFRFKNTRKIERLKRLTPHLELIHATLERIYDDAEYLRKLRLRNNTQDYKSMITKVCQGIDEYRIWYLQFQSNGLKPELAESNKSLYAFMSGLFVHSQMVDRHKETYLIGEVLDEVCKSIKLSLEEVEKFLKY